MNEVCQWQVVRGIYTWLGWSGEVAEPIVCPCGAVRSPAGSGGGRMYISACAGGNCCCVLDGCLLSLSL